MEMVLKRYNDSDGNLAVISQEKESNLFKIRCYDAYLRPFKAASYASLKAACAAIKRTEKQTGKRWEEET